MSSVLVLFRAAVSAIVSLAVLLTVYFVQLLSFYCKFEQIKIAWLIDIAYARQQCPYCFYCFILVHGYLGNTGKVKERIVLSEIHLRTTGRHLSMGSHSVICHPTEPFSLLVLVIYII